jgi:hypothetical protein
MPWAPGQPGRLPAAVAPMLQGWVKDGPQSGGRDRATWPSEELTASLYQRPGIEGQRPARRVFCQRQSIRPSRPTYRCRRSAPEEQRVAREELAALKKALRGEGVLLSQDAARFPLVPPVRALWGGRAIGPPSAHGIPRTKSIVWPRSLG